MPETPENQGPLADHASEFEDWLNILADQTGGLTVYDLDMMATIITIRLRSVFTAQQMHERSHGIIAYAEKILQTPGGLVDDQGNEQPAMLVENFQGDADDLTAMLKANTSPITDELIDDFFTQEEE